MEKPDSKPPMKFVIGVAPYKSSLVYRQSDYYSPKSKYYDDVDLEAQEGHEKAMLAESQKAAALNTKAKRRRTCSFCCCALCYIQLIFLLVAIIIIVKLIPKAPDVSLGDFRVNKFVVNGSQPSIQASLSCDLNVTNRNPHAVELYSEVSLGLLFTNVSLGSFTPSNNTFEQRGRLTNVITENLSETVTTVTSNVASLRTQATNSNVQVALNGNVKGKHRVLGWKVGSFDVAFSCLVNIIPGNGGSKAAQEIGVISCYY